MKPPSGRRMGDSSQEEDSAGKTFMEKWLGQEPQVQRPHAPAEGFPAVPMHQYLLATIGGQASRQP